MSQYDKKPASVLVDMGLIESAPDKKLPYLVITGPIAQGCDKHGFPPTDEIRGLEEILDATGVFMAGVTAKKLTGTLTTNCQRLNYYYVADTVPVRNALRRMYDRNFTAYSYVLKMKYDPQWISYRTFLYPDDETQNWMENNKIITAMLEKGDSSKTARDIIFSFSFPTDSARSNFSSFAIENGYKTGYSHQSKNTPVPYELQLIAHETLKMETINHQTATLKSEVKKHKGVFNGWYGPGK